MSADFELTFRSARIFTFMHPKTCLSLTVSVTRRNRLRTNGEGVSSRVALEEDKAVPVVVRCGNGLVATRAELLDFLHTYGGAFRNQAEWRVEDGCQVTDLEHASEETRQTLGRALECVSSWRCLPDRSAQRLEALGVMPLHRG